MKYSINLLKNELKSLSNEFDRISSIATQKKINKENRLALIIIGRRHQNILDAIEILDKESTVDEL